jgi:hypothetical protein
MRPMIDSIHDQILKIYFKKQKYTTNQKHLQEYTLAAHGLGSKHLAAHSRAARTCVKNKNCSYNRKSLIWRYIFKYLTNHVFQIES